MANTTTLAPGPLPPTLDALKDAVGFVANGRPVSQQLLETIERMLSHVQERTDMVQLVTDHHQMDRLLTTLERTARVEGFFFGNSDKALSLENQLKDMQPKERIALLSLLYKEVGALTKYLGDRSTKAAPTSPSNAIQDAADPRLPDSEKAASVQLQQESRDRIRSVLESLRQKASVIEMQPEMQPCEEDDEAATNTSAEETKKDNALLA